MKKKQKFLTIKNWLFFTLPILIIVLFLLLSPKISSEVFSFKRHTVLNEFINSTKANGRIDPQAYWKFREFYSPGSFIFSKNTIDKPFLTFSSSLLESTDILTEYSSLNEATKTSVLKENIIFKGENSLIYKQDKNIIKIVFLLSNDEMRKANGFFDYNDKDKKITENKKWLNITTVKTN